MRQLTKMRTRQYCGQSLLRYLLVGGLLQLIEVRAGVCFTNRMGTSLLDRGGAASTAATTSTTASGAAPSTGTSSTPLVRVAYQGEPGAYSDKATRELLGDNVMAIGKPNFEACFRAVASMECDYACLPIENSLGGSIHENYDLMLRYDLTIVAEHEFRVHHCLLVKKGVKRDDIKFAISHPQALAQCDNYLRGLGITPIPTYDTAGSAKMISEGNVPEGCTVENTAAIASDLAGKTYGLHCLASGIEDDDTNFTRFLLLGRKAVVQFLTQKIPAKTSIVFTLPNTAGALYKALACFSLRDIDFSKIESRPTSASLLNFLKFRSQQRDNAESRKSLPRFRYCFYLDFLASELDETAQNALAHLREQANFLRILGSYPQKSRLVGPVAQSVEELRRMAPLDPTQQLQLQNSWRDAHENQPALKIGIIGFGAVGQHLARRMVRNHQVSCLDPSDKSSEAQKLGVEYFHQYEMSRFLANLDVVVLAVPLIDFQDVVQSLPVDRLRGKLVVDVCPLNAHPKAVMLRSFGPEVDILCSHPMLGVSSTSAGSGAVKDVVEELGVVVAKIDHHPSATWDGRPMIYEKVRVTDVPRCDRFLKIFEEARCQMVEMAADEHDASIADAEFVTHLTGRLFDRQTLPPTPVLSKEYAALCDVVELTAGDSFDLFFGMFKFNARARDQLNKMRENLARIERQLAAKEAYLEASAEMKSNDRHRLLAETKSLLQELLSKNGGLGQDEATIEVAQTTTNTTKS